MDLRRGFALLILSCTAGCTAIGGYLQDRALDLADVFTFESGYGVGLHADARVTDFIHPGIGYAELQKAAVRGRTIYWTRDREVGLPVSLLLWWPAMEDGYLDRLGHWHVNGTELRSGQDYGIRKFDIDAGMTLGVLHVRVGFSPGELLDFILGFIGIDIAGDDRGLEPEGPRALPDYIWIPGDAHAHTAPPDDHHASLNLADTLALARREGVGWIAVTPHLWSGSGKEMSAHPLAANPPIQAGGPAVLRGWELSRNGAPGHCLFMVRSPEEIQPRIVGQGFQNVAVWWKSIPDKDLFVAPAHPFNDSLKFSQEMNLAWSGSKDGFVTEMESGGTVHGVVRKAREAEQESWKWANLEGQEVLVWSVEGKVRFYSSEPLARIAFHRSPEKMERFMQWKVTETKKGNAVYYQSQLLNPSPVARFVRENSGSWKETESRWKELHEGLGGAPEVEHALNVVRELLLFDLQQGGTRSIVRVQLGDHSLEMEVKEAEAILRWEPTHLVSSGLSNEMFERMNSGFDGLEVYNHLVHLGELVVGIPEEKRHEARSFEWLDREVTRRERPLAPLGGADNHRDLNPPCMWVLAADRSSEAVFDALKAGRCVAGGPETISFEARADGLGEWWPVGSELKTREFIELRWRGRATLWKDGVSLGSFADGHRIVLSEGDFHHFRIVQGVSHSGYIVVHRTP